MPLLWIYRCLRVCIHKRTDRVKMCANLIPHHGAVRLSIQVRRNKRMFLVRELKCLRIDELRSSTVISKLHGIII